MNIFKKHKLELIAVFLPILLFLAYKLSSPEHRFGDGNAYFYMADILLKGQVPYRDFLIADPPLLIYLLAPVRAIIGNNLELFLALPPLVDAITALVLFLNLKKHRYKFASLAPAIFLFSFLIISTSNYVTGLHIVLLLLNLALLFDKKPFLSGVFWGLASMIKLYTAPGLLIYCGWLLYKKHYSALIRLLIGFALTCLLIVLPFLMLAPVQLIEQILLHQFNRPPGISKLRVFTFFFVNDLMLIILGVAGFIFSNKELVKKVFLFFLAWLIFYLVFKDLYYVYLGILAPWLTIGVIGLFEFIVIKWRQDGLGKKISISLILLLFFSHLPALNYYYQNIRLDGLFIQADEVAQYINSLEPGVPLYGSHEVAPLIALMTDRELFNQYADTNAQVFGSGALDIKQVSKEAMEEGVFLLTKIANLEINQQIDSGFEGYFDREIFDQYCQRLEIIDGSKREVFTDVGVYWCRKNDNNFL